MIRAPSAASEIRNHDDYPRGPDVARPFSASARNGGGAQSLGRILRSTPGTSAFEPSHLGIAKPQELGIATGGKSPLRRGALSGFLFNLSTNLDGFFFPSRRITRCRVPRPRHDVDCKSHRRPVAFFSSYFCPLHTRGTTVPLARLSLVSPGFGGVLFAGLTADSLS